MGMSTVNKELYDALLSAKVPEEKAAAAAAVDTNDMTDLKVGLAELKADVNARMAALERVGWGILLAVVGLIVKSLFA